MRTYLLRRLLLIIPTLFGITIITFAVIQLAPGDPAQYRIQGGPGGLGGPQTPMTKDIIEQTRKLYGLDKPRHVQYALWLKRLVRLDFGTSFKDQRPVLTKIAERLPVTLTLNIISIFCVYLLALPIGVLAAIRQNSLFDRASTLVLFILYSLPSFWVATLLIMFLCGGDYLDLFPAYGIHSDGYENYSIGLRLLDYGWHLILPVVCFTYGGLAFMSRFGRSQLLEVIRLDYVRTARAKGVSEKLVIFKHATRNALIPIVTLLAGLLPSMIGGSVIIEKIFSIQGMGLLMFEGILSRDYPLVMGVLTVSALLTLVGILISDLLYVVVDPRISFEDQTKTTA